MAPEEPILTAFAATKFGDKSRSQSGSGFTICVGN